MTKNKRKQKTEKSLSVYIHIPFCVKKCDYCDFLSMPAEASLQAAYMETLLKEIKDDAPGYRDYEVTTVFIGGGTPSVLDEAWIEKLLLTVREQFRVSETAEISMECNPGTVTKQKMEAYVRSGINRLSIGMQSADDITLQKLGRIHTYKEFVNAYELALEAGITNLNVDVMSALPGQTFEDYCLGLETLMKLPKRPGHISAYSLIIEEGTPFYERYADGGGSLPAEYCLPDEDTERKMYDATEAILQKYGYHRYEISNYALPGYECRHNKRYWTREPYVGFGIGAASLIENRRFKNHSDICTYLREGGHPAKEEDLLLSQREQMEEFLFLGLRLMEGISREDFYQSFGITLEEVYGTQTAELKAQGLLEEGKRLKLTKRGIDVSNYVFEKFLE